MILANLRVLRRDVLVIRPVTVEMILHPLFDGCIVGILLIIYIRGLPDVVGTDLL